METAAQTRRKQRHRWRLDFAPVTGHEICLVGVELRCPGIQSLESLASRPCRHSAPCERAYTGTVHCTNTFTAQTLSPTREEAFPQGCKKRTQRRHIKVSHRSPRSTNAIPPPTDPPHTHSNTTRSTPHHPLLLEHVVKDS